MAQCIPVVCPQISSFKQPYSQVFSFIISLVMSLPLYDGGFLDGFSRTYVLSYFKISDRFSLHFSTLLKPRLLLILSLL